MHGQIFRVTVYKTRKRMCEGVWVDGDSACVREFCKRARVQWHLRLRRRRRTGVTKHFQFKYIDYTFTIEYLLLHIYYSTLIRGCGGARCWRSPGVPCARCASSRPTGAASAPPPIHKYTHTQVHRYIYIHLCVCIFHSKMLNTNVYICQYHV
jgi:hypothetical protein